ncbi:hypothetical protein M0812_18901 [Anaeramoeba flamelloides]|uniref:Uncharacterized protein n=1 Tax=Anaeramoeba flamelloides TaxID=1746091 RepID=A0AAV7Z735_9EUKA|nr:hypothetical protein M0812_18901 [Anaeramoeba flamelloides]
MKLIEYQKVKWILVFLFFNFFLKSDQLASWIAGRVYDGEGNTLTSIFQVNTPSGKTVGKQQVAGLGEKRFVIVWEATELQSSVFMGQAFTENGTEYQKYQNEVTIFSKTLRYGPKVVSLLGGERFAVIGHNDDSSLLTIQILESDNITRVGREFGANSPSNDLALLRNCDLCTIMNEEKLVYVWYNYNATVEQKYINAQISDSDGNLLQSEFQVTEFDGTDHIDPRVTGLKSGSGDYYVITWASNKNQEDGYGVFGQILQYPNTFVGEIFQVNTEQTKAETLIHQSAALPNSSQFVIT